MTDAQIVRLLELLDTPMEILDYEQASSIVIMVSIPETDFVQAIGPYRKDTAEVLEVLERLQAEAEPCDECPVSYRLVFMFPTSYAEVPAI